MEGADGYLKIPMFGFTESLNILGFGGYHTSGCGRAYAGKRYSLATFRRRKKSMEMDWTKRSIKSVEDIIEHYYKNKI